MNGVGPGPSNAIANGETEGTPLLFPGEDEFG